MQREPPIAHAGSKIKSRVKKREAGFTARACLKERVKQPCRNNSSDPGSPDVSYDPYRKYNPDNR